MQEHRASVRQALENHKSEIANPPRKFQISVAADVNRRKLKEWRGLTSAATRF